MVKKTISFINSKLTIKKTALLLLILISLIPLILFDILFINLTNQNIKNEISTRLNNSKNYIQSKTFEYKDNMLNYARLISNITEISQFISTNNHLSILQFISPLATKIGVDYIIITDNKGLVLARSDRPSEHGTNLLSSTTTSYLVRSGLSGLPTTLMENTQNGILINAVSEIKNWYGPNKSKIIGTVILGTYLNRKFLDDIYKATGISIIMECRDALFKNTTNELNPRYFLQNNHVKLTDTIYSNPKYSFMKFNLVDGLNKPIANIYTISNHKIIANNSKTNISILCIILIVNILSILLTYFLIINKILKPIDLLIKQTYKISNGILDDGILLKRNDEFGHLSKSFSYMVRIIKEFITNLKLTIDKINISTKTFYDLVDNSRYVSEGIRNMSMKIKSLSEEQFLGLQIANEKANVMTNYISQISTISGQCKDNTSNSFRLLKNEQKALLLLIEQMFLINKTATELKNDFETIKKELTKVQHVNAIVTQLAEKTKIVSLNARIEAAKYGDVASGFSVISEEITKLSDETNNSAKIIQDTIDDTVINVSKIHNKIEEMWKTTTNGYEYAQKSKKSLDQIESSFVLIDELINKFTDMVNINNNISIKIAQIISTEANKSHEFLKLATNIEAIAANQYNEILKLSSNFDSISQMALSSAKLYEKYGY